MEPIISPWIFYFIGVADSICAFFIFTGSAVIVLSIISVIVAFDCFMEDELKIKLRLFFKIGLAGIFLVFISLLIPSKEICYKMLIAKYATKNNVSRIISSGKDVKETIKNDVIDIIKSFNEKKDK